MEISATTPLREVAFEVCTALDSAGIRVVLTGGGAATCYAGHAYQSRDLDFVLVFVGSAVGREALATLGYQLEGNMYVHARSPYTLDFIDGPLAIGDEVLDSWSTEVDGARILNLLTPTDCVRDRLSAFLYWNDRSSLNTAVAVARVTCPDLEAVEAWGIAQGYASQLAEFMRLLRTPPGQRLLP